MDSIEMKIAMNAVMERPEWGLEEPKNIDEAKSITGGSEKSSVKAIITVLGLDPSLEEQLLNDIYNKDAITPEIVEQIQKSMIKNRGVFLSNEKPIIDMLSVIHDGWVQNNPSKFLQEGRNREYQFAPLMLLDWKEVESDLVFLKPILEVAGIKIDKEDIKQQFEIMQKEFLIDNGIYSHEDLISLLSRGAEFYPALEGIETENGGNIEELLKRDEILEKMAKQIEDKVPIKSRGEMAVDIIKSDNPKYDSCAWVTTSTAELNNEEKFPKLERPISKREVLLSKSIGKPYPTTFLNMIANYNKDGYQNKLESAAGHEYEIDLVEATRANASRDAKQSSDKALDEIVTIEFGYDRVTKMPGSISVSIRDILIAGLDPKQMGIELNKKRNLKKDIVVASKRERVTKTENKGIKGFINKLLDRNKGREEK